jgi:hypothetical protein
MHQGVTLPEGALKYCVRTDVMYERVSLEVERIEGGEDGLLRVGQVCGEDGGSNGNVPDGVSNSIDSTEHRQQLSDDRKIRHICYDLSHLDGKKRNVLGFEVESVREGH